MCAKTLYDEKKKKWDIQVCIKMSFFIAAAPLKEPDELAQECGM